MSAQAMGWVLDHSQSRGAARLVMLAIANHIDSEDGEGWAYVKTLLREAGVSHDTYLRVAKQLVADGELERKSNAGGKPETKADVRPNRFRFPLFAATREQLEHTPARGRQDDHPAVSRGPQEAHPDPNPERQDAHPAGYAGCPPIAFPALAVEQTASVDETSTVFEAWQASTGKTRARLDAKRRRLIRRAIASHGIDDVLAAVVGWRHSAHHRGENDRRTVYNDLGLLLRDASKIEYFRDLELNARAAPTTQVAPVRDIGAERHRQRENGTACPTCSGDLWLPQPDGTEAPCPDCSPLAVAR